MSEVKILCTANCEYATGDGYYKLCKHPSTENAVPYGGIDRYYLDRCELFKKRKVSKDGLVI